MSIAVLTGRLMGFSLTRPSSGPSFQSRSLRRRSDGRSWLGPLASAQKAYWPHLNVSERLGHSDIAITLNTYSHAIPAMEAEAAEKIAALVASANTIRS